MKGILESYWLYKYICSKIAMLDKIGNRMNTLVC